VNIYKREIYIKGNHTLTVALLYTKCPLQLGELTTKIDACEEGIHFETIDPGEP